MEWGIITSVNGLCLSGDGAMGSENGKENTKTRARRRERGEKTQYSHAGHATLPDSLRHPSSAVCALAPKASKSGATITVEVDSHMLVDIQVSRCRCGSSSVAVTAEPGGMSAGWDNRSRPAVEWRAIDSRSDVRDARVSSASSDCLGGGGWSDDELRAYGTGEKSRAGGV